MRSHWQTACLLACVLLVVGCGKKPAPTPLPAVPMPSAEVLGKPWTVPDLGLELVFVEAGSFTMGSKDGVPAHEVHITRPFWMGKFEVTQAEYEAVTGANPSVGGNPRTPVVSVSWTDAVVFCAALTARERGAGRLPDGYEFRLPTEAEWEYAARGGGGEPGLRVLRQRQGERGGVVAGELREEAPLRRRKEAERTGATRHVGERG